MKNNITSFIILILIVGGVFFSYLGVSQGYKFYQNTKQEQLDQLVLISDLQFEMETIKNKKPQIITKTVTIDNTKYVSGGSNEPDLSAIIAEWTQNVSTYQKPYYWGNYEDSGYIKINATNQALRDLTSSSIKLCTSINIGDKLVVLGYPGVGSSDTITATEGIVAGIEQNYYVTSAKIEHGNSGGAAILLKDNCWLGIPSYGEVGSAETLGRILKSSFIIN